MKSLQDISFFSNTKLETKAAVLQYIIIIKMFGKILVLFVATAFLATVYAIPLAEYVYDPSEIEDGYEVYSPQEVIYEVHRSIRSLQPGAPNLPAPGQQNGGGWEVNPNVGRDDVGNTKTSIDVQHKGKDHDFNAGWGKVVRGPGKAKPTWHVGGTYRW